MWAEVPASVLGQVTRPKRNCAGPFWGVSGPGHVGLLGGATAKTLGLLPSQGGWRPSVRRACGGWRSERSVGGHVV